MKKSILKVSLAAATLSGMTCALAVQDIPIHPNQNDNFNTPLEFNVEMRNSTYDELSENLNGQIENYIFDDINPGSEFYYFGDYNFEESYISSDYAVKTARETDQPIGNYSAEGRGRGQYENFGSGGGHQGYQGRGQHSQVDGQHGYPSGQQGHMVEHREPVVYPESQRDYQQGRRGEEGGYFVQYAPTQESNEQSFQPAIPQNGAGGNSGYMPNYGFDLSQISYPGDALDGEKIWQLNSRNGLEIAFSYGDPTDKRERKRQKSRPKLKFQKLKQLKETIDQVKSGELEPQISMNITVTAGNYEYAFFWDYGPVMIGQMTIWYDLNGDIFELPVPVSEEFWGKGTARYAEARFCPIDIPVRAKIIGIEARVWEGTMSVGPGGPMGTLPMSHDADERQYVLWGELPVLTSSTQEEEIVEPLPEEDFDEQDEEISSEKPVPMPAPAPMPAPSATTKPTTQAAPDRASKEQAQQRTRTQRSGSQRNSTFRDDFIAETIPAGF